MQNAEVFASKIIQRNTGTNSRKLWSTINEILNNKKETN